MEKNEISWTCSTYGERCVQGFGEESQGKDLEDLGVDGRIILRMIFRKWNVGAWAGLVWGQDRGRWRALVNAVKNLQAP
jgi:hypothetical protein